MKRKLRKSIFEIVSCNDDGVQVPPGVNLPGMGNNDQGGGSQIPPPPPQAAFDESRVNQIVNGAIKGLRNELTKTFTEGIGTAVNPITEQLSGVAELIKSITSKPQESSGREPVQDPQLQAKLLEYEKESRKMRDTLAILQEENKRAKEDAERADRNARIRAVLSQLSFVSDDAAETAFDIMSRQIRRDENGNLVGGPEEAVLPFDVYVKETINSKHAYLLGSKQVGGTGAYTGGGGNRNYANPGSLVGTTEMIKPGMRPEERAAVVSQIQQIGQLLNRQNNN